MIVIVSVANERFLKMPNEIALLIFTLLACLLLRTFASFVDVSATNRLLNGIKGINLHSYLIDGVLCFMLFAGAGKVSFGKFKANLKIITLFAFLSTAVSALAYGILFYFLINAAGFELSVWYCILLGCIVSPTDPIAATGIMNKLGLSKSVTTVIESESLFNDGMGVVLFIFVKSIVENMGSENFVFLMAKEVLGAAVVAVVVSAILFKLIKISHKPVNHICISLLLVSSVYVICEILGFSGVIASVVCGMIFSYEREKAERYLKIFDSENIYEHFWDCVDEVLNSVLFVIIGFCFLVIPVPKGIAIIAAVSVVSCLASRAIGISVPVILVNRRKIPGGYNIPEFVSLMTWSALKGGLTLALVLSTAEFLSTEIYGLLCASAFYIIFFTVIVQGLTTKKVYRLIERHKAVRIRRESDGL